MIGKSSNGLFNSNLYLGCSVEKIHEFSLLGFSLLGFSLLEFSLLEFSLLEFSLLGFSLLGFSLLGFSLSFLGTKKNELNFFLP